MKNKCPLGHEETDYVDFGNGHSYIFCYTCNKKYFKEDYMVDERDRGISQSNNKTKGDEEQ